MRFLVLAGVAAAAAGCGGGVTHEELTTMRTQLLAHEAEENAKIRADLLEAQQKYQSMREVQLNVEKKMKDLEDLEKQINELSKALQARIDLANASVLKVLEFEERLLADRLAGLRGLIEEMKKK